MLKFSLKKTTKDKRDFKLSATSTVPLIDFIFEPVNVKNQETDYSCSGHAGASVIEYTEKVAIAAEPIYGWAKKIEGDMSNGAELRSVCKVLTKIGAVEETEWNRNLTEDQIKKWWEWNDEFVNLATKHRQKTFWEVTGKSDFFDNVRSSMWEKKLPCLGGTMWFDGWTSLTTIDKEIGTKQGGHAQAIIGQKIINDVPYIITQNSWGKLVGDKGRQYWSRDVFNKHFKPYKAFMFLDMTREEAEELLKNTQISLLQKVINLLKDLLQIEMQKTLLDTIKDKLGQDASPLDKAPDKLACAETVSTVLREYLATKNIEFPVILGTGELWSEIRKRTDLFERLPEPVNNIQGGDLIISPTGSSYKTTLSNGHCGFFLNATDIASNTSLEPNTGLFIHNYTRETWRNYFHIYGGFPTYIYRLKV